MKIFSSSALVLATLAMPAAPAIAQNITVSAPANMDEDRARDWARLERDASRMAERITDREGDLAEEERELANAQERLARAEAHLRDEERERDRAAERLAQSRDELARLEARMVAIGGTPAPTLFSAK